MQYMILALEFQISTIRQTAKMSDMSLPTLSLMEAVHSIIIAYVKRILKFHICLHR
jgi:hypothetical protein